MCTSSSFFHVCVVHARAAVLGFVYHPIPGLFCLKMQMWEVNTAKKRQSIHLLLPGCHWEKTQSCHAKSNKRSSACCRSLIESHSTCPVPVRLSCPIAGLYPHCWFSQQQTATTAKEKHKRAHGIQKSS